MEFVLRPARPDDYIALCPLFEQLDALHRERLPWLFQRPDEPVRTREYFEGLLADPQVAFLVAQAEDGLAGFVHALLREAPGGMFRPRRYAIIDSLVVAERYQRLGAGQRLMQAAEAWACARRAANLELVVYEFNRGAYDFYERLGYETLNRRLHKRLPGEDPAGHGGSGL